MKILSAEEVESIVVSSGGRSDKILPFMEILCEQKYLNKSADNKITLGVKYWQMNFFSLIDIFEPELSRAIMDSDTDAISKFAGTNVTKEESEDLFTKTCCMKIHQYIEIPSPLENIKYSKPVDNEETLTYFVPPPVNTVS